MAQERGCRQSGISCFTTTGKFTQDFQKPEYPEKNLYSDLNCSLKLRSLREGLFRFEFNFWMFEVWQKHKTL